jgi:hypothetical protein
VGAIAYHPYPYGSTYASVPNILATSGAGAPVASRVMVRNKLRDLGLKYGIPVMMVEVSHSDLAFADFNGMRGRAIHIKVYITEMGRAIGQYARWVPRGSVRIDATSDDPLVQVTAFRDGRNGRIVLVAINNATSVRSVRVDVAASRWVLGRRSRESNRRPPLTGSRLSVSPRRRPATSSLFPHSA